MSWITPRWFSVLDCQVLSSRLLNTTVRSVLGNVIDFRSLEFRSSTEALTSIWSALLLSLTYKVLTTTKPSYLYDLISLQPHRCTRSSDVVTVARPPCYSSLKVNNRSFRHASARFWNKLRHPVDDESLSLSSHISLTSSSPSPLSLCITPSLFHFRLKTYLVQKSFPPWSPSPFRIFITISGLNCSSSCLHICGQAVWFGSILDVIVQLRYSSSHMHPSVQPLSCCTNKPIDWLIDWNTETKCPRNVWECSHGACSQAWQISCAACD